MHYTARQMLWVNDEWPRRRSGAVLGTEYYALGSAVQCGLRVRDEACA